jgi:hypothetical protein
MLLVRQGMVSSCTWVMVMVKTKRDHSRTPEFSEADLSLE